MRDEYRRGEFEARNRQLPADLNQSATFGANQRARTDFDAAPVGTPPSCYDVRSVYDSRPINGYDFHIVQFQSLDSTDTTKRVEMTVPEGYAAVLRGFEAWFEPAPLGANRSDVSANLQLNGGDYPNNTFLIGMATNGLVPMFMLADEFNRIGLKLNFTAFTGSGEVYVHFYGNFILKSERALPFEIANPVNDPNCKPAVKSRVIPRASEPPPPPRERPTLPSAPVLTAPPVATPPPMSAPEKPSFPINWAAAPDRTLRPFNQSIFKQSGQKIYLSKAELQRYATWLRAQIGGKERELFENYLRAVGVT